MVNRDVFLTAGGCAENWLLSLFEIVLMEGVSAAITNLTVYFILFCRLVTSTYISLWVNQVSSTFIYCHLESLIPSLLAAVANKSFMAVSSYKRWIRFQVTTHRCFSALCV